MKVLVIWRLLTVGGVNAGWRNRAISFKQHGIDCEFLYTTDHGGLHIMEDIAPVYLTKDKEEIVNIIRQNQYDAIIAIDTKCAYKWIRCSGYSGPVIVEARTPEILKLKPHVEDFLTVQPNVIVVPSHYQKRLLSILRNDVPIEVIHNGVDTTIFRPLSDEELDLQAEPILPTGKKIVGWVGRLDKRKNWRLLLQIARLVKEERDDIEFWMIGGAQSMQRDEFAAAWQEQGLTDIVKWHPVIPYQQMPHVYAKIRQSGGCYLATTRGESFGNTFIESMACGVPVVAPQISSIPELVLHGKTGRLYREDHVRGAVNQIYRLVDNPSAYSNVSEQALAHVSEHFDIPYIASSYIDLLRKVVEEVADR